MCDWCSEDSARTISLFTPYYNVYKNAKRDDITVVCLRQKTMLSQVLCGISRDSARQFTTFAQRRHDCCIFLWKMMSIFLEKMSIYFRKRQTQLCNCKVGCGFADISLRNVFRYTRSMVDRQQIFFGLATERTHEPCVPTLAPSPLWLFPFYNMVL